MHFSFTPRDVCCKRIDFTLTPVLAVEGDKVEPNCYVVTHIQFKGGCQGNLSFIAKTLTGYNVNYLISILKGHKCGTRSTSCMDQFGQCLERAKAVMDAKEWTPDDCY